MPLFPSYLFVNVEFRSRHYYQVIDTRGVVNILGDQSRPLPVPAEELQVIQAAVASQMITGTVPWVQKGRRVRVVAGPLCGIDGVIEEIGRRGRLGIAIASLGQSILVDIELVDVEACE
jgi:transcription antitermination factor NusG